jgi:hypothetical protein
MQRIVFQTLACFDQKTSWDSIAKQTEAKRSSKRSLRKREQGLLGIGRNVLEPLSIIAIESARIFRASMFHFIPKP